MAKPKLRPWPADKIQRWKLTRVHEYARNARIHTDEQIEQIAASMKRFGVTAPLLVDEHGELIYGHGRFRAAQRLGFTEMPVAVARGWSEEEKAAYRIADNQLTLIGEWDESLLAVEVQSLANLDFDISLMALDPELTHAWLNPQLETNDPEATPELPKTPYVKRGEIWKLDKHRIMCGDATDTDDVKRLLEGARPHLMVTDPPYGVDYDPTWRNRALNASPDRALGVVRNDEHADWSAAWKLFPGDVIYAWHGSTNTVAQQSLIGCGFDIRAQLVWGKSHFVVGRGHYHVQHELLCYAVRKGKAAHWRGGSKQTTLWLIDKAQKNETGHSTQKPVECMRRPIENNSKAGDLVYDPFVGSGTTIIASEMMARGCLALEIDPAHCQVAIERWQDFTGKQARREGHASGSGRGRRRFREIADVRV